MSILLFSVYLIFGDISIWWWNFFGSQAKKLDLSLSLNSSLAWLINQAKPSQVELKLFGILTSSSSNIVFRLISSLIQAHAFDFYWQTKFKHALLDKAWLIYSPTDRTKKINKWKTHKKRAWNRDMGYFTFDELIREHSSLTHHMPPSHVSIKVQQFPLELVLWVCVLFGNEREGETQHPNRAPCHFSLWF